jgi:hypothetical protein
MWWVVNTTPRPLYPPGKTRHPLYSRLGGPQGRSGRERKIAPPPGIDPRTVNPVPVAIPTELSRPTLQLCTFPFTYINKLAWRCTLEIETCCHIKAVTYRLTVAVTVILFSLTADLKVDVELGLSQKHVLYARTGWQLRLVHKYGAFKLRRCEHASKCKRAQTSPVLTSDLRSAVQSRPPYCCSIKRKKQQQNARGRMPAINTRV